ncbi:PP2C family protein-serine/threonine phosphatase [Micromonospora sp. SCSIO 07396]
MARRTAMVVSATTIATMNATDLRHALTGGGVDAVQVTPDELIERVDELAGVDAVFVSSSLGLQHVALLSHRLGSGRRCAVLVFPEGDLSALEACVRAGFDYVTPPFLPALLDNRLASAGERGRLVTVAEEMAAQAVLRRYERDLRGAAEIQAGFLPDTRVAPSGWGSEVWFRPAREVSGDFYDYFDLAGGHRWGFLVADVCDKGLSAAMFMALIRGLLRHSATCAGATTALETADAPTPPAGRVGGLAVGAGPLVHSVEATNAYLLRTHRQQGYFVTLFFGVLDPVSGALLFVNAGHNAPVLLRASGEHTLLAATGPAVGMVTDRGFALGTAMLAPGDTLFVYTDGVVDARSRKGEPFGFSRLLDALRDGAGSPRTALGVVQDRLDVHVQDSEQFDDITMLALRHGT